MSDSYARLVYYLALNQNRRNSPRNHTIANVPQCIYDSQEMLIEVTLIMTFYCFFFLQNDELIVER
jgi:hypothetical protein